MSFVARDKQESRLITWLKWRKNSRTKKKISHVFDVLFKIHVELFTFNFERKSSNNAGYSLRASTCIVVNLSHFRPVATFFSCAKWKLPNLLESEPTNPIPYITEAVRKRWLKMKNQYFINACSLGFYK